MWEKMKLKMQGAAKSMTIWFNGIVGSGLVLLPSLQDALPQLGQYIDHKFFSVLGAVTVSVNIWLRAFKTKGSLEDKVQK